MTHDTHEDKPGTRRFALLVLVVLLFLGTSFDGRSPLRNQARKAAEQPIARGEPLSAPSSSGPSAEVAAPGKVDLAKLFEPAPPPKDRDGYQSLTLAELSRFDYPIGLDGKAQALSDGSMPRIPDGIQKLDQTKVSLSGYMMPLDFKENSVSEFILVENQMLCCFGQTPDINEWVLVMMEKPVEPSLDRPITVSGTLLVGEVKDQGEVLCLYKMTGEHIEAMEP